MMFRKAIVSLASRTNCAYTFDGENVAHLIELGADGKPSKNVWRKTFICSGDKITVKVHGKTLAVMPLAAIA